MYKFFGKNILGKRKGLGLTVQEVADKCGTSRSYITLIENGKRLPSKKVLPKLAVVLNVKTSTVLNWYLEDISQKMQSDLDIE